MDDDDLKLFEYDDAVSSKRLTKCLKLETEYMEKNKIPFEGFSLASQYNRGGSYAQKMLKRINILLETKIKNNELVTFEEYIALLPPDMVKFADRERKYFPD